jgi:uncharacterized protein (TIGR03083 family)
MIDVGTAQAHLRRSVEEFQRLLSATDLAAPVPSCPSWTVDDLVRHVCGIYRWVGRALGVSGTAGAPAAGADRGSLVDWYRTCAAELQETLRSTDPDQTVPTFDDRPGPAAFWSRRQAHETAVHLWDLGTAGGRDLGYDEDLALDGIDEVVTMFFPRQVALGRIPPLDTALALAPVGQDRRWVLAGDGTTRTEAASTALSGPAGVLVLALWGRCGVDDPRLRVQGDPVAAAAVLAAGIVP